MNERYASEFDRITEEKERDRYDDWAAQIEVQIPECEPGEVPDIHECELLRRCDDSRGEWYCHRGQGCQEKLRS